MIRQDEEYVSVFEMPMCKREKNKKNLHFTRTWLFFIMQPPVIVFISINYKNIIFGMRDAFQILKNLEG